MTLNTAAFLSQRVDDTESVSISLRQNNDKIQFYPYPRDWLHQQIHVSDLNIGQVTLTTTSGTNDLVSYLYVNLLQLVRGLELIWVSHRFHLWVSQSSNELYCLHQRTYHLFRNRIEGFQCHLPYCRPFHAMIYSLNRPKSVTLILKGYKTTKAIPIMAIFLTSMVQCKSLLD